MSHFLNKQIEANLGKVVSLKLRTGEEVVGRIESYTPAGDDSHFGFSNPLAVYPTQNGVGLAAFLVSASVDNEDTLLRIIDIPTSAIMMVNAPNEAIAEKWLSTTVPTQKVVAPSKKILTPGEFRVVGAE